jgi:hypothetical protein
MKNIKKIILLLVLCNCSLSASYGKINIPLNNINFEINKIEFNFIFTLFKDKKLLGKKIIITNKNKIKELVSNISFKRELKYHDSVFKRKPDIILDLLGKKKNIRISIWEDEKKLRYAMIESNNKENYYSGISNKLCNTLFEYYKKVN